MTCPKRQAIAVPRVRPLLQARSISFSVRKRIGLTTNICFYHGKNDAFLQAFNMAFDIDILKDVRYYSSNFHER